MSFRLGRNLFVAGAFLAGGPMAAMAAYGATKMRDANRDAKNHARNQDMAYQQQASAARNEQIAMNKKLDSERAKLNAGIARGNRSRSRGGIFGDSDAGNSNPLNSRLG